jgi:hypothetical protein
MIADVVCEADHHLEGRVGSAQLSAWLDEERDPALVRVTRFDGSYFEGRAFSLLREDGHRQRKQADDFDGSVFSSHRVSPRDR